MITKRQSVLYTPSVQLSITMTEMLEYIPLIYSTMNVVFKYIIFGYFSLIDILCALLSIVNAIIPMQSIVEVIFPPAEEVTTPCP